MGYSRSCHNSVQGRIADVPGHTEDSRGADVAGDMMLGPLRHVEDRPTHVGTVGTRSDCKPSDASARRHCYCPSPLCLQLGNQSPCSEANSQLGPPSPSCLQRATPLTAAGHGHSLRLRGSATANTGIASALTGQTRASQTPSHPRSTASRSRSIRKRRIQITWISDAPPSELCLQAGRLRQPGKVT